MQNFALQFMSALLASGYIRSMQTIATYSLRYFLRERKALENVRDTYSAQNQGS